MIQIKKPVNTNYSFIALFLVVVYLSYLILKPFFLSIVSAMIFAFVFFPVYRFFLGIVRKKSISAFLVIVVVLFLVLLPLFFIFNSLYIEATNLYSYTGISINALSCANSSSLLCSAFERFSSSLYSIGIKPDFGYYLGKASKAVAFYIYNLLKSLPSLFLYTFVVFFMFYYFLVEHEHIIKLANDILPMKKKHKEEIFATLASTTKAVVYGQIITAFLQGLAAGLGFWIILKMSNPLLWALITAVASVFPFFGAAIAWVPVSLYFLLSGLWNSDYGLVARAIVMFGYGMFVVSNLDNFIKPKIMGGKAKLHPALVLLGIFGGLYEFGFVGLFLGPIILNVLVVLTKFYTKKDHF